MLLLHNLVTALKSPRLCCTALNSVSRMLIWSWETATKRQFVHALQIAFNIGRRVGSPLHFTLWWKQRVGNKVGGGAGNKALVGFNLRSAGGHTERGSNQSAISKCHFYTFYTFQGWNSSVYWDKRTMHPRGSSLISSVCSLLQIAIQVGCIHNSSTWVRLMIMLT